MQTIFRSFAIVAVTVLLVVGGPQTGYASAEPAYTEEDMEVFFIAFEAGDDTITYPHWFVQHMEDMTRRFQAEGNCKVVSFIKGMMVKSGILAEGPDSITFRVTRVDEHGNRTVTC